MFFGQILGWEVTVATNMKSKFDFACGSPELVTIGKLKTKMVSATLLFTHHESKADALLNEKSAHFAKF